MRKVNRFSQSCLVRRGSLITPNTQPCIRLPGNPMSAICPPANLVSADNRRVISIDAADKTAFNATLILPAQSPRALIQIAHGMAEHAGRYEILAAELISAGFAVLLHNHRGHGERTPAGHLADRGQHGWQLAIDDIHLAAQAALQYLPEACPHILLGHSMGAFMAQHYAMLYGEQLAGLVLSGSCYQPPRLSRTARRIVNWLSRVQGFRRPSALLNQLVFGPYNLRIKDRRSEFDWLSRDTAVVDAYIADPLCGGLCTLQFWSDFFQGLMDISSPTALSRIPAELPILLFSGDADPVGRYGKGVMRLHRLLQSSGHPQTSYRIYPAGRHEMLNEINRNEVVQDLLHWLHRLPANT
jgi:alpha-beta hydrolase superfamily lysophospholipase